MPTKSVTSESSAYWSAIARNWHLIGPPLRPDPQDLQFLSSLIARWPTSKTMRALVLGATPEFHSLAWPASSKVLAVDRTQEMLSALWPGESLCANWLDLPLADASRDLILCDGGLHLMQDQSLQKKFVDSIARVIAPDGLLAVRLFLPSDRYESVEEIFDECRARKIANVHQLKFRLWMSLRDPSTSDVMLDDVWNAVQSRWSDFKSLFQKLQWPPESSAAIDAYRGRDERYCFLPFTEIDAMFCAGGFERNEIFEPTYDLGRFCPTIVYRRSDARQQ